MEEISPRVIMLNTISVYDPIKDFELDIGLHYEIGDKIRQMFTRVLL